MRIADTVVNARDSARQRMSEAKMDRATRELDELRFENRMLRDELDESRSERKQFIDLLEKMPTGNHTKRRYKLLRMVAMGGAVYAVAAKSGWLERAKDWWHRMQGRGDEWSSELESKSSGMTHRVGDTIEHTGRTIKQTGRKLEETGEKIEQKGERIERSSGGTIPPTTGPAVGS
jgi:hypothetical protein